MSPVETKRPINWTNQLDTFPPLAGWLEEASGCALRDSLPMAFDVNVCGLCYSLTYHAASLTIGKFRRPEDMLRQ